MKIYQINSPYHLLQKKTLFEPQPSLEGSARPILNWAIRVSLLWISQQYFCYKASASPLRLAPNLKERVSLFPSYRVVQSYPQAPGSLPVAFYESQGYFYTGRINNRRHKLPVWVGGGGGGGVTMSHCKKKNRATNVTQGVGPQRRVLMNTVINFWFP